MGRPRVLKYDINQYITFKNFTEEEVKALTTKLMGDKAPTETPEESDKTLPFLALGTYKEGKHWKVVTIKYNPRTTEAVVEKVEGVGELKASAGERFKVLASENDLV